MLGTARSWVEIEVNLEFMDMAPNREQDSGSDRSVTYTVTPQLVGFNTHLVQF
jgi:hypothetical protein